MRSCLGPSVLLLLVAAGCSNVASPPTSRPLGVITLGDSTDGAGGYVTRPTAAFWDASNVALPGSNAPAGACIDTIYSTISAQPDTIPNQLDAGSPLQVSSILGTGIMTPDTIPNIQIVYRLHGTPLPYTPGANVTFVIPGASGGFASGSIPALTAKRLILGPIPGNPPPTDSMQLTWTAGTPGTDAVNFYMIYETSTALAPNRQIICSFDDAGSGYVPASMAAHWADAFGRYQQIRAFRWVTTYQTVANNGLIYTYSKFDTTAVPVTLP